jgi:hypothetical protein
MLKRKFKMNRRVKVSRYARIRRLMAEYGFPLQLVMCGRVVNGRFYLTHRTK